MFYLIFYISACHSNCFDCKTVVKVSFREDVLTTGGVDFKLEKFLLQPINHELMSATT